MKVYVISNWRSIFTYIHVDALAAALELLLGERSVSPKTLVPGDHVIVCVDKSGLTLIALINRPRETESYNLSPKIARWPGSSTPLMF